MRVVPVRSHIQDALNTRQRGWARHNVRPNTSPSNEMRVRSKACAKRTRLMLMGRWCEGGQGVGWMCVGGGVRSQLTCLPLKQIRCAVGVLRGARDEPLKRANRASKAVGERGWMPCQALHIHTHAHTRLPGSAVGTERFVRNANARIFSLLLGSIWARRFGQRRASSD